MTARGCRGGEKQGVDWSFHNTGNKTSPQNADALAELVAADLTGSHNTVSTVEAVVNTESLLAHSHLGEVGVVYSTTTGKSQL